MNRYSLRSDSRRWWWPAGAAGVAASGVLAVSLLAAPSGSEPAEAPPDLQRGYAHIPADGVMPTDDVQRGYAHIPYRRCPPPPDPAYVGAPWVAHTDECPTLSHWWTYVR